jgi:hypothetical protein
MQMMPFERSSADLVGRFVVKEKKYHVPIGLDLL